MEKFHQQTALLNSIYSNYQTNTRAEYFTQKIDTTLQRKAENKNEIKISNEQLHEASWLFKQYELKKPGWLRRRFVINQRRRKLLNQNLKEAGLDGAWCAQLCNTDDWAGCLHKLWHAVNEVKNDD